MSFSKIYFLFFPWNILFLRGKQPVLGFNHWCPEFRWVAQYWWRMKMEKWKRLKVLKLWFAVYWVFKNSHGGKRCIQGSESWSWATWHHGRGQAAHPSVSQGPQSKHEQWPASPHNPALCPLLCKFWSECLILWWLPVSWSVAAKLSPVDRESAEMLWCMDLGVFVSAISGLLSNLLFFFWPVLQAATWRRKKPPQSGLILLFKRLAGVKERH